MKKTQDAIRIIQIQKNCVKNGLKSKFTSYCQLQHKILAEKNIQVDLPNWHLGFIL